MSTQRYPIPDCIKGHCSQAKYSRWLQRKATTHARRDRKRAMTDCTITDTRLRFTQPFVLLGISITTQGSGSTGNLSAPMTMSLQRPGEHATKRHSPLLLNLRRKNGGTNSHDDFPIKWLSSLAILHAGITPAMPLFAST
jgi:hypothetical protein